MKDLNKIKQFDLTPFSQNKIYSNTLNTLDKNIILNVKEEIKKIVRDCEAILMHPCDNFENFSGRDIDSFCMSCSKLLNINEENIVLHQRDKGAYRFLINDINAIGFINLDVEDLTIFSSNTKFINNKNFNQAISCNKTGLRHFDLVSIIFYKLVKYFQYGVLHSYEQLHKLKIILDTLKKEDLDYIMSLTSRHLYKERAWIKYLLNNDFEIFEKNIDVKKFWIKKRIARQKKRKVFAGKVNLMNLFKSTKFIYAFFLGAMAKWPKNHRPMPALAIIGNDGSGKTTIVNYIIKNFSKMDPVLFTMKSDTPMFSFIKNLREWIKRINNTLLQKKLYLLKNILSFFGQIIDLFDKYLKYKIGMAWADAGYGITIFERYVTDKIRGEFPNKKSKILPLEQFFPFPDGIIYLDIRPEVSIKRKINDNHTLDEMRNKRENYISLIAEFSDVKIISCDEELDNNIKAIKNYIFELAIKKRNRLKSGLGITRCIWKKNRNRLLVGDENTRFQKDSFL
jgi:thymidylate kinase